jgi:phosphoribosylglycinamide formyltransferase 1
MLTEHRRRRIAVLVSGRGSNLQAIMRAVTDGRLVADIGLVLSNRAEAQGLAHAAAAALPTRVLAHGDFADRNAFDAALAEVLVAANVDLVCLAGFMRRVGPALLDRYPRPMLNIHPSLLPAFPGMNAQQQAVDHGAKITGVTVHFVTAELDAGPIVLQRAVPILDDDTGETLSARMLPVEHDLYPEAIQRVLYRPWRLVGRRVQFDSDTPPLR